uniref:Uncharacterized protein n=1 Tax=Callorhinchus milii TaxID=7868 RepID=A0A4W3K3D9_CALMI
MGQCVTKCKYPLPLGSKTGDKESDIKSHGKKSASPSEEINTMSGGILANGTKKTDLVQRCTRRCYIREGMELFCNDLSVDRTDFIELILAKKFQVSLLVLFKQFLFFCKTIHVSRVFTVNMHQPCEKQSRKNCDKLCFIELLFILNGGCSFGLDFTQLPTPWSLHTRRRQVRAGSGAGPGMGLCQVRDGPGLG